VPEGLKSMTLSLHNVIPSGEESLIDSGELRYSIHIDRSYTEGSDPFAHAGEDNEPPGEEDFAE